jgi:serine/threonine protein kinase
MPPRLTPRVCQGKVSLVSLGLGRPESESDAEYLERSGSQVSNSCAESHYKSLQVLSRRENATLEKCLQIETDQLVAVKAFNIVALKGKSRRTLKRSKVASPWQKLQVEVAIMKKVDHPLVVQTLDVITDDTRGYLFLVMEWINGTCTMAFSQSFNRYASAPAQHDTKSIDFSNSIDKPVPEILAKRYFRDAACGLAYIHSLHIVHRDLKPENIVVHRLPETGRHVAKICDFGESKSLEDKGIRLYDTQGTPPFASPESFLRSEEEEESGYDGFSTDVWALGVTLCCYLSQELPFPGTVNPNPIAVRCNPPPGSPCPPIPGHDAELENEICDGSLPGVCTSAGEPLGSLLRGLFERDPAKRLGLVAALHHEWTNSGLEPLEFPLLEAPKAGAAVQDDDVKQSFDLYSLFTTMADGVLAIHRWRKAAGIAIPGGRG